MHVADHDNTVTEHDEAVAIADPATSMFILEPVDALYGLAATKPQVLMQHAPALEVGLHVVDAGHVESIEAGGVQIAEVASSWEDVLPLVPPVLAGTPVVLSLTPHALLLQWPPPASPDMYVSKYVVMQSQPAAAPKAMSQCKIAATVTTAEAHIQNLRPGQRYSFVVVPYCEHVQGPASDPIVVTTPSS